MSEEKKEEKKKKNAKTRREYLFERLEKMGFNVIGEIIEIYRHDREVFDDLASQVSNPKSRPKMKPINVKLYENKSKEIKDTLATLLKYCYPALKGIELTDGGLDKVQFNITIPEVKK